MSAPLSPYDPQPAEPGPAPAAPVEPGHSPLEIPAAPQSEPIGIPATVPDGFPGPDIPSDPQPRA